MSVFVVAGETTRVSIPFRFRGGLLAAAWILLAACSDNVTGPDKTVPDVTYKREPPAPPPTLDPPAPPVPVGANPILAATFWVDPGSDAQMQADAWRLSRPNDAAQMEKIAAHSHAQWFGEWSGDIFTAVSNAVATVAAAGATPVFVTYNIPQRDCGGLSAGGASVDGYKTWISEFAKGLAGTKAVIILEPDALTQMDCLSSASQTIRLNLLRYAVQALRSQGGIVYLDGGHSAWKSANDQASRLTQANVAAADGFFLNVSNFQYTSSSVAYGMAISALVGGKHFVIDTSRNGLGPTSNNQWCNPPGRGLGAAPTTLTADPVDAFLWIKPPGESDGKCNRGPSAGSWWPEYALGLAQRAVL